MLPHCGLHTRNLKLPYTSFPLLDKQKHQQLPRLFSGFLLASNPILPRSSAVRKIVYLQSFRARFSSKREAGQLPTMTHEIFMTAVVPGEDAIKARAILGGYTEMRERRRFTRVRHQTREEFGIKGLPTIKELQKERGPNAQVWQELHQIFVRQAYTIQERVDVTDEILAAISK